MLEEHINSIINRDGKTLDKGQQAALRHLQEIASNISKKTTNNLSTKKRNNSFWFIRQNKEAKASRTDKKIVKGMYLWGEVGRGKTWLMDLFFLALTETLSKDNSLAKKIQRIHFHEFMLDVHKKLQSLPSQPDPLKVIAKDMSKSWQLICLDEFHVMDIADAVILHGLLQGLFDNDVIIVTTSNRHPDDLYKNGSHRERFLPAIDLIKQYCTVFKLESDIDYRKQESIQAKEVFFVPHHSETNKILEKLFNKYSEKKNISMNAIKILGREIPVVLSSNKSVWFSFDVLCRGPRSSNDYLHIAKKFKLVIISEIPILHEGEEGPARRFLNLIDAFYDLHVHLILSSSVIIEDMYQGNLLQFEFKRALSRLHEMQSQLWWQDVN